MDFFKGIGDFFRGAFGGGDSDAEKKRKEAAARAAAAKAQAPKPAIQSPNELFGIKTQPVVKPVAPAQKPVPTPVVPQAAVAPTLIPKPLTAPIDSAKINTTPKPHELDGMSDEDKSTVIRWQQEGKVPKAKIDNYIKLAKEHAKIKAKSDYENSVPGRVLNTAGEAGRMLGGAIFGVGTDLGSRVIETVDQAKTAVERKVDSINPFMSEKDRQVRIAQDSTKFKGYDNFRKWANGVTNAIAGNEHAGIKEETDREASNISQGKGSPGEIFSAALKSVDLAGFLPIAKISATAARGASPELIKMARNAMEESLGRKLTKEENTILAKEVGSKVDEATAVSRDGTSTVKPGEEVPTTKLTDKKTPDTTPEVARITEEANSKLVKFVQENPQLTKEQIDTATKATQDRINQLKKELEAGQKAAGDAVDAQGDVIKTAADERTAANEAVAAEQAQVATPQPGDVTPPVRGNAEVDSNNGYTTTNFKGDEVTLTEKEYNSLLDELYNLSATPRDQRTVIQATRLSDIQTLLKNAKEAPTPKTLDIPNTRGLNDFTIEQARRADAAKENPLSRFFRLVKSQGYDPLATFQKYDGKGAVGDNSITSIMRRLLNPEKAIEERLKQKVITPNGNTGSVWEIIKKYGKADKPKAKDFANYRMFKDELWRTSQEGGQAPSLRIDPAEMARYVAEYEAAHPDAIVDNSVLRHFALQNLKERADAGIDSQAIFEASSRNPFYSPRTRASSNNKDLMMSHSGGFTTTSRSTAARTGADVAVSPLDLYRLDARNTEVGVLKNKLGGNFYGRAESGNKGFETDIDPNVAVAHREARNTFQTTREQLLELRDLRDSLKGDRKMSKVELETAATKVKALEDRAVESMKNALNKAKGKENDILSDVANRDPRYAAELATVKGQKFPGLTPKEAREQIKFDIKELDAKYPDPNITTRKELLDLAESLDSGRFSAAQLADNATNLRNRIPDLQERLDGLTGMQNQARQDVNDAADAASQAWKDVVDTTQNATDFSGNVWTFKVDGEVGRGTAPAELAAEMSRLFEFAKPGSKSNLLLRGMQTIGSVTKAFWTGPFAPVWQTLNVAKNFGLMVHNGHWLEAFGPNSIRGFVEGLVPISARTKQFISNMKSAGASYENLTQSAASRRLTADDIAARANIGTFLLRNPVNTFKDFYHMVSSAFTHVANAQRNAIAYQTYTRAVKNGVDPSTATHMAVDQINQIFGDLQRVSELAQAMEPLIPYSGATQSGIRSLVLKAKTNPAEFAVKQASIVAAGVAFTLYSMNNANQYYKDQIEKGYTTELDNNFIIVLPGAAQDADGNWSNVVKIPITPDFRPLNRATWRSAYSIANGQGIDGGLVAGELFNEFTGDMSNSVYDKQVADKAGTPVAGLFTGSPAVNTGKILTGTNPSTGTPLSDSDMALRDRTDQSYDSTSTAAKDFSKMTNGFVTPIQADKLLGQLGGTGKAIKNGDSEEPLLNKFFNIQSAVYGGSGQTEKQRDSKQYFDDLLTVAKSIDPSDKATLKAFQALHSKKSDKEKENMLNSATKSSQFMQYSGDGTFQTTALYNAEKALDDLQRQQGKTGNPMFDLPAQELQKVLMYRSLKAANSAGQNYSKGGESAFTALGLDDKWYQDYRDAESAYYKSLNLPGDDGTRKSFSGKQKVELSDAQKALQSQYFALPAKSNERRAFLAANPWMKDYWASDNEFTDQERKALGFDSLNGDGVYDGNTGDKYGNNNGINAFGQLSNFSADVSRFDPIKAKASPNTVALFKKLMAGKGGGKSKPTLGASASGR